MPTMTVDPAISMACAFSLAAVFVLGLAHKLGSPATFLATLRNYRLLPGPLLVPAAVLIIAAELCVVPALLLWRAAPPAAAAAALLLLYSGAIAVNLLRGRRDIDCGCSGAALRQTLQPALLVRNTGLVAVAIPALLPDAARPLVPMDFVTAVMATLTAVLLYAAGNQLMANGPRLRGLFT